MPLCTIVIVTRARSALLLSCLKSIGEASKPFSFEVLIVGNGEEVSLGSELGSLNFIPRIITTTRMTPAAARNFALPMTRGQFICFLDDDVEIPPQYFERFQATFSEYPHLDILGGPDRTVERAHWNEKAIGLTLHSPLATATTRFRHGGGSIQKPIPEVSQERQLILCNLWIKRSLFVEQGHRFDERFTRNEENVLLHELRHLKMFFGCL